MQEREDASDQFYESISSDNSLTEAEMKATPSTINTTSLPEDDNTRQIVFPQKPRQFDRLFDIYQRNAKKMEKLKFEVKALEDQILEIMRAKSLKKQIDVVLEDFEELNTDEEAPINQFLQKRNARVSKLQQLTELYESLKRINKVEAFLLQETNLEKMMQKIKSTKKVISYRINEEHLTIVAKHRKQKQSIINIEQSGIFLPEPAEQEKHYSIFMIGIRNLHHWLTPKTIDPTAENLEQCRQDAEMVANMIQRVNLKCEKIITTSYSHQNSLLISQNVKNQILVHNLNGHLLQTLPIGRSEEIVTLEILKGEMIVCTKEGVVRLYSLSKDRISLKKVLICFYLEIGSVDSYRAVGAAAVEKIVFTCKSSICSYCLKTNTITNVGKLDGEEQEFIRINPILTQCFFSAKTDGILDKDFPLKMAKTMKQREHLLQNNQLIGIFRKNQTDRTSQGYQLLFGDQFGSLQLINL